MLLTIHNLPTTTRYFDVKALLEEKCGLTELILDNLIIEGKTKRVTVGLADEGDAAILVRKINGLYVNGQQLYVEDKRKKKDSDQPYRSSASFVQEAAYQETVNKLHHGMEETAVANMNNHMKMNYNMSGMYMPMMPVGQNVPYMGYGIQAGMDPRPPAPAHKELEYSGFEDDINIQATKQRDGSQGHDKSRHLDRTRRPSPERPAEVFNRSRWNDNLPPNEVPVRREKSPPRQFWAPPEINRPPRPPLRQPEQSDPRDQNQYQPRKPVPEFRRTDPQWETRPSRSDALPNPQMRSEPELEWGSATNRVWESERDQPWEAPNQAWVEPNQTIAEPNRAWADPNQPWKEPNHQWEEAFPHRSKENYPRLERYERNERHFDTDYSSNQNRNEPYLQGRDYSNDRDTSRQPEADWNKGKDRRDRNVAPNSWDRDRKHGERREDGHRPAHFSRRPNTHVPKPSSFNSNKGNERRGNNGPNPSKRSHSDRERGPDNWNQIANDYPAFKKPKGKHDAIASKNRRDRFENPRPNQFPPKENTDLRQRPFRQPAQDAPFTRPDPKLSKPVSMKNLINKDQTNRGQATAMLAKQAMLGSTINNRLLLSDILKQLKLCIKGRIDVMLGEELSTSCEDIVERYRVKVPKKTDRSFYQLIRDKCIAQRAKAAEARGIKVPNATSTNIETAVQEESNDSESTVSIRKEQDTKQNKVPDKAPKHPITEKQIIREYKQQRKLEYTKEDLFKLDPITDKALDDQLEKMAEVFTTECKNPKDDVDEAICKRIATYSAEEFKKVVRLHITKRILNVCSGLPVRIFAAGKFPKREAIKQYLRDFKIHQLSLKQNKKGTMYVANIGSYEDYDRLCRADSVIIDGIPVTFKSMNLVSPGPKITKSQIAKHRREFIRGQIEPGPGQDATDSVEDEFVEFSEDVDVGNLKEDWEYTNDVDIGGSEENLEFSEDVNIAGVKENLESSEDGFRENLESSEDVNVAGLRENLDSSEEVNIPGVKEDLESSEDVNIAGITENLESSEEVNIAGVKEDLAFYEDVDIAETKEDLESNEIVDIADIREEDLEEF